MSENPARQSLGVLRVGLQRPFSMAQRFVALFPNGALAFAERYRQDLPRLEAAVEDL